MERERLRFGLIGLGIISQMHEIGYGERTDRATIEAVCDIDGVRAEEVGSRVGAGATYTDYKEMLAKSEVDAVDIALPHVLHYEVAKYALLQKKHVLMEKPLCLDWRQGQELIDLAKKQGVVFSVAEDTPFMKAHIEARRMIQSGVLGAPRHIRTFVCGSEVYRLKDTSNWKGRRDGSGGGAIIDAGVHSLYLIKWLAGEIDAVQAFEYKYVKEAQVEDCGLVVGTTKGGAFFSCEFSFIVEAPWNSRLEFHGSEGSLIVDQLRDPVAVYHMGGGDLEGGSIAEVPYSPAMFKIRAVADGVKDFIDALWDGRAPGVDTGDANYAVKVIQTAYESVAAGRALKVS